MKEFRRAGGPPEVDVVHAAGDEVVALDEAAVEDEGREADGRAEDDLGGAPLVDGDELRRRAVGLAAAEGADGDEEGAVEGEVEVDDARAVEAPERREDLERVAAPDRHLGLDAELARRDVGVVVRVVDLG